MGLYVHSLGRLPTELEREYYLYILDYGWDEPLSGSLHHNFRRMADLAARNKSVIIAGTEPRPFADEIASVHFDDEKFSWQRVNGEAGDEVLPALMIATTHPSRFLMTFPNYRPTIGSKGAADDKLIILSLRGLCKSASDVTSLVERVFRDIAAGKALVDFEVAKEIIRNDAKNVSDAFILKPSLWGVGVDLRELLTRLQSRRA